MAQELFPIRVKIPWTNVVIDPGLSRNIWHMRKPRGETFNETIRRKQAQYLVDEGIASLESTSEVHFLRSYANGKGLGTLSTPNLIKCIGYLSSGDDLRRTIERDLLESIGLEKLQRLESCLKAYRH
ncbi:hypothetical protein H6501_01345 [Candidatus Woesearchaeota archaeon]|nr:hypothetical protein [Nanoarchaeota archaeon]MCB9370221.1 hypothetical protein [Candidatus Woesearchaeota archaeon]USN44746.1 MAG: hypothetical protein H6500_02795 [Candidatus Woesearchaeota archaeon]